METMTGSQNFNRTQQEEPRVGRRLSPIKMMTVTAVTVGTAQTIITAPEKRAIEVKSLMISNITAVDVTFNLYAVPAGGPTDGTTSLLIGPVIKANSSDDLVKYIAKLYEAGSAIKIFCNTANAVKIMGMVEEVF